MKSMTLGTFLSCLFLSFTLGFLMCHKVYLGLEGKIYDSNSFIGGDNPSLSRK
jgi:hypothetical protein